MKKAVLLALVAIMVLLSTSRAEATNKEWICHNGQSTYAYWILHWFHSGDYQGMCQVQEEPTPTPTPTAEPTPTNAPDPTPTPYVEEEEPEATPTPEPTPETRSTGPSGCTENCYVPAPQCEESIVVNTAANFHIYRKDGTAYLKWHATGGNQVHAFWKHPSDSEWRHSKVAENTGYMEIYDLANADWTFGLSQHNNCGGGVITSGTIVEVVDGATDGWVLFR